MTYTLGAIFTLFVGVRCAMRTLLFVGVRCAMRTLLELELVHQPTKNIRGKVRNAHPTRTRVGASAHKEY